MNLGYCVGAIIFALAIGNFVGAHIQQGLWIRFLRREHPEVLAKWEKS